MSQRTPAWASAARAAFGLASRVAPGRLPILIFHRVLAETDPLLAGEVDVAQFERLMRLVAASFDVMPLGHAMRLRAEGRLPRRALVVTFDDGYADNATRAVPVLQRLGLRATFFVATSFLDGGRMFNDTVIECIRRSPLDAVDLAGFGLGKLPLTNVDERRQAIEQVLPRVKYLGLQEREDRLRDLVRLLRPAALPDDLMMSTRQLQGMHSSGMEIGGHTHRHPILRLVPDDVARSEVAEGRRHLQDLIQAPVDVFAYPNGRPMQDYEHRHRDMLADEGFVAAVNTAPGVADERSDALQLPRYSPWRRDDVGWALQLLRARSGRRLTSEPLAA